VVSKNRIDANTATVLAAVILFLNNLWFPLTSLLKATFVFEGIWTASLLF
jgi:hypothetical protein